MPEGFLGSETESAAPAAEKPTRRKRGPMPEAQKQKLRASAKARKGQPKPEAAPSLKTGITSDEADELRLEMKIKAAEDRIRDAALSADNKLMVHQEIKVDVFNTVRRYVELTPSMCRARNCPFDAAVEAGATAWGNAPIDQETADGRTFGERLIAMREYHEATGHTVAAVEDHIITAGEMAKRQWNAGQSIKNEFLQGAK